MPQRYRLAHVALHASPEVLHEAGRQLRLATDAADSIEQLIERRDRIVLHKIRFHIQQALPRVTEATRQPVAVARIDALHENRVEHHRFVEATGKGQTNAPAIVRHLDRLVAGHRTRDERHAVIELLQSQPRLTKGAIFEVQPEIRAGLRQIVDERTHEVRGTIAVAVEHHNRRSHVRALELERVRRQFEQARRAPLQTVALLARNHRLSSRDRQQRDDNVRRLQSLMHRVVVAQRAGVRAVPAPRRAFERLQMR
ncbi:hypothetical protein AWB81_07822 [Caballeronia arationis]|nr:hypothetical protein AWB81_07822 [Caballeronia arationis]